YRRTYKTSTAGDENFHYYFNPFLINILPLAEVAAVGRSYNSSRLKCRSYNRSVGRSGLSVERALIVGVTFLSRFGLLNPPIPRCCLLARRWRAFAAEMPLLQ